jgi:hypothetical protein
MLRFRWMIRSLLRWMFRSRSRLQVRSHVLGWRDTFHSKPLSPVSRRAQEIVMDVGGVVHPIPPHPCLITWLQGWNNLEKLQLCRSRKNGLKNSRTFMVGDCPRVFTLGGNNSSTLWYILFTLWHFFIKSKRFFDPQLCNRVWLVDLMDLALCVACCWLVTGVHPWLYVHVISE